MWRARQSSHSLVSLAQYRDLEEKSHRCSTVDGALLEYEHLELRIHPPEVRIIPDIRDDRSIIALDSANRPGTLVEVVQCLTELGMNIHKARISSDGGWFVDEFFTDRITDQDSLLNILKGVLSPEHEQQHQHPRLGVLPAAAVAAGEEEQQTVFELSGPDKAGLLADVVECLQSHGCGVQSAAVWTSRARVAFVVAVSDSQRTTTAAAAGSDGDEEGTVHAAVMGGSKAKGQQPAGAAKGAGGCDNTAALLASSCVLEDSRKLGELKQLLWGMMDHDGKGDATVRCDKVRGAIHFDRRLHQLLLKQEEDDLDRSEQLQACKQACSASNEQNIDQQQEDHQHEEQGQQHHQSADSWAPNATKQLACSNSSGSVSSYISSSSGYSSSCIGGYSDHGITATAHGMDLYAAQAAGMVTNVQSAATHSNTQSISSTAKSTYSSSTEAMSRNSSMQHNSSGSSSTASSSLHTTALSGACSSLSGALSQQLVSPKAGKPEVIIRHDARLKYWLVDIRCKDRPKLFFDTVCTLADLAYDIFHASVDVDEEAHTANLVYYIRKHSGDSAWNAYHAGRLCYMLEAAIQRRFPKGVKVRIQSWQQYDLAALTAAWRDSGLLITRAKVRPCMDHTAGAVANTFYLLDGASGAAPDAAVVHKACTEHGGVCMPSAQPGTTHYTSRQGGSSHSQHAGAANLARMSAPGSHGHAMPSSPMRSMRANSTTAGTAAAAQRSAAGQGRLSLSGTQQARSNSGLSAAALEAMRERYTGASFGYTLLLQRQGAGGGANSPSATSTTSSS